MKIRRLMSLGRLAVLLLLSLSACSSGGDSPPTSSSQPAQPTPPTPAVTAVGTVTGAPVTGTIGAQGGTLKSADGSLTLTVPPGAVATNTQFSIQPITNLAPGGIAGGYRLLPDGQTFVAPVELALTYTDQDVAGSAPEVLGIAFQDQQGRWNKLKTVSLDTATKTLKATTTHFSDWVRVRGFFLSPGSATVKVGNPVTLRVVFCDVVDESGVVTLLAKCNPEDDDDLSSASDWSVNGVLGGGATVGTVKPVGTTGAAGTSAIYTAPSKVPSPALVEVSARLDAALSSTSLVAIIKVEEDVFSGYEGTSTYVVTGVDDLTVIVPEGSARVIWELVGQGNNFQVSGYRYRIRSGTLSIDKTVEPRICSITWSSTNAPITAANSGQSELIVDYSTSPPRFTIEASTNVPGLFYTFACPTGTPVDIPFPSVNWGGIASLGVLAANTDGSVLSGSVNFPQQGNSGVATWTHSYQAIRATQ